MLFHADCCVVDASLNTRAIQEETKSTPPKIWRRSHHFLATHLQVDDALNCSDVSWIDGGIATHPLEMSLKHAGTWRGSNLRRSSPGTSTTACGLSDCKEEVRKRYQPQPRDSKMSTCMVHLDVAWCLCTHLYQAGQCALDGD